MPDQDKLERRNVYRLLGNEVLSQIGPLTIGSVSLIASSLANQSFPRLVGRMIDRGADDKRTNGSSILPSLGIVIVGGGVASFLRTTTLGNARDSIAASLRKKAFATLLSEKDLEWFHAYSFGSLTTEGGAPSEGAVSPSAVGTILTEDVDKVSSSVTISLANILRSSSSVLFSTFHMLRLDAALFGAAVTIIPAVGAVAMLLRRSVKKLAERQRQLATIAASFVEERLSHIAVVKMSNREIDEIAAYREMQDESARLDRVASLRDGFMMSFMFAASSGALMLVVSLGGRSVAAGNMSSGQLTSFATYSFLLGLGFGGIVKAAGELTQGLVSADRYYQLVATGTRSDEPEKERDFVDDRNGEHMSVRSLSFRNVCFGYRSTCRQVLKGVNFTLECGKVTALVGRNGSGKTTTAALLAGLYQPLSGSIELSNKRDLASLTTTERRRLVQVIPQSTTLFNMSILENVRYSNPDATERDVAKALSQANCEEFVSNLDGGVHFNVGLNGAKVSGGERQRLALARALLSDPVVLVMDEPASSLDAEGELAVEEAILACKNKNGSNHPERAMLLISHNAKSLELVDEVLVIKDGTIVEAGSFKKLQSDRNSELCRLMPELT